MMSYRILSDEDKSILRMERVKALEADLYRAQLAYEDALSTAERDSLAIEMEAFSRRLEVHYKALGLKEEEVSAPSGDEGR